MWNPLLFFWLTRKQKRMLGLSRIINTSEVPRFPCVSLLSIDPNPLRIPEYRIRLSTELLDLSKGSNSQLLPIPLSGLQNPNILDFEYRALSSNTLSLLVTIRRTRSETGVFPVSSSGSC